MNSLNFQICETVWSITAQSWTGFSLLIINTLDDEIHFSLTEVLSGERIPNNNIYNRLKKKSNNNDITLENSNK